LKKDCGIAKEYYSNW